MGASNRSASDAHDRVRVAIRASIAVAGIAAAAIALWMARTALLLGFVAILLAAALSFPVGWVQRVVRRRGAAVLIVLVLGAAAIGGLGAIAAPRLVTETTAVVHEAPRTLATLRRWLHHVEGRDLAGESTPSGERPPEAQTAPLEKAARFALPAAAVAASTVVAVVLVIVLALFLVHEPDVYRRAVRHLVGARHRDVFDELWVRLRRDLRRWVGGIFASMLIMGSLAALGLLAAGIQDWALLGTLTFLGTFVPYLGAIASAVPGLLVAAGQSERHVVLALAVYAGVHVVEGYLVQPLVMRRAAAVRPAVLLAAQAVFGAVFGLLGVVVATPAVVCLKVVADVLWIERRDQPPPP